MLASLHASHAASHRLLKQHPGCRSRWVTASVHRMHPLQHGRYELLQQIEMDALLTICFLCICILGAFAISTSLTCRTCLILNFQKLLFLLLLLRTHWQPLCSQLQNQSLLLHTVDVFKDCFQKFSSVRLGHVFNDAGCSLHRGQYPCLCLASKKHLWHTQWNMALLEYKWSTFQSTHSHWSKPTAAPLVHPQPNQHQSYSGLNS